MRGFLRLLFGDPTPPATAVAPAADGIVEADGHRFQLLPVCRWHDGLPHADWAAVGDWCETLPEPAAGAAWLAAERTWLRLLAAALGDGYRVLESPTSLVLTRQPDRVAASLLGFVDATFRRVQRLLEELAEDADVGKEILLAFDEHGTYYRYVSHFHADEGEFPMSAGMFLSRGMGHFVVHGDELQRFEPTIVHEMTHSLVSHLPLPAWVNEGMAVNSEQRLTRVGADIWSTLELEAKHRAFWTPETIQEFWNGAAYGRTDEGQELAYDLGRILVNGMSSDWPAFKAFAAAASLDDGGDAAAREHLHLDLGEYVRHFLDAPPGDWGPRPAAWPRSPERGGFAPDAGA